MLPVILAGAALLQGLMSQKAQAEQKKREMEAAGIQNSFATQQAAQAGLAQGQTNAMNQMVEGFRGALQPEQVKFGFKR